MARLGDTSWYHGKSHVGKPKPGNALAPVIKRGQPILTAPGVILPAATPPLSGYVRLTVVDGADPMSIDMLTTGEPYMLPDGYAAGWTSVPRQGRVALPSWTSGIGLRQAIPITMDVLGYRALDVQDEWEALQRLARPLHGARPPVLTINGPVDHQTTRWVISGFAPDQASTKRRGSRMVRQDVLITLSEWVDVNAEKALRRGKPAKDKPRTVITTSGLNTLRKLAKHYLGNGRRWKEIAKLNHGLHSPDRHIAPNTKVRVPPK
jgi:hypothetical protein